MNRRTRLRDVRLAWSASWSSRAAVLSFGVVETVALPLRLRWAHGAWFTIDDWELLYRRSGRNFGDLFRPYAGHWSTLIILAYRALWSLVGLRYLPYELLAVVLYLAVAALMRAVMRRAGVGPWVATLVASLLVFFGAGVENNFFTSVLMFGLIQLLLADHDGPIDRRDGLGLAAGFAALLCSGLAVPMTIVVGLAMLLRRGWRIALLHTVPIGSAYLIWFAATSKDQSSSSSQTPGTVVRFVGIGLQEGFRRLGQLPGFGIVVAVLLVAGLGLAYTTQGIAFVRGRGATPIALLAGTILYLVLTAIVRSGQPLGPGFSELGPGRARDARYAYVVAAMALPALALAVDALIKRWRQIAIVFAALLAVSIPSRVHEFRNDARKFALSHTSRQLILTAPRLPLATQLPRDLAIPLFGYLGGSVRLGWLRDNLASGKLPPPDHNTPGEIATVTLQLALEPSAQVQAGHCRRLLKPTTRVLRRGALLTVKSGDAYLVYLARGGGRSRPRLLKSGTVRALAGPLKLRLVPAPGPRGRRTIVCG